MKQIFILIIFSCLYFFAGAQEFAKEKYALTTSSTTIGAGSVSILDPYLSPFDYNGFQIRVQNNSRRYFNPENNKLSYSSRLLMDLGKASHPSGKNSMLFFNTNYMAGVNYHFRPAENLMFLAGASWDIGLGGKYLSRNVNNPFSLDLYTDLNATAEIQYQFNVWKRNIRLQYGVATPLVGCMFVPMQNESYYELFVLDNTQNAFHISSLHNKRALYQQLNIDIPFKYNTLRFGIQHDYLKYSANDVVYRREALTFSVGAVMHFYTFKGKKDKIPVNFIHSYE